MKNRTAPRGIALVSALIVVAILLMSVAGLFYYVNLERGRAINLSRDAQRMSCAETGLQLAKAYFGRNQAQWNTFLADPAHYNPIGSGLNPYNPTPADPYKVPAQVAALRLARPELFLDIDQDSQPDVFIYIRDNQDELPPNTDNWARDNDQNVIVGALCISPTMRPRTINGQGVPGVPPPPMALESLLSFNMPSNGYTQANGGDGTGNYN